MADAYGKLIFSCSDDAKFNSEKIVQTLNYFIWENWGGKWIIENNKIYYDGCTIQYPTVYPTQITSLILLIDGVEIKIHPSELTEENEEFQHDDEVDFVPLEDLRNAIGGFIKNGWIEIACIANEKIRYIYFEELRIYSNGKAYRRKSFVGGNNMYDNSREEEFLPSKSADKTEAS